MKTRKFPRTDLSISELGLNVPAFRLDKDDAPSFALLDAYHAAGGRFIQAHGSEPGRFAPKAAGYASEEVVGRWQESRGIDRDQFVLATRVNFSGFAEVRGRAFIDAVRASCERSLGRLRTGYLDLLIWEGDGLLPPLDDMLAATDLLIRGGSLRYAVADGVPSWRVVDSIHRANIHGHARFEAVQAAYSLMTSTRIEAETLTMCRAHRLGFIARSPLAGGLLGRRPWSLRELINVDRPWQEERAGRSGEAVLRTLADIADRHGAMPAQIALAWVLRNPLVTSALVSPLTSAGLHELAGASDLVLSEGESAALAAAAVRENRLQPSHA